MDSYVYVVAFFDTNGREFQKIGITGNIKNRIGHIQTCIPFKLHIRNLYNFKKGNSFAMERAFHSVFSKYRLRGEWFEVIGGYRKTMREFADKYYYLDEKLDDLKMGDYCEVF